MKRKPETRIDDLNEVCAICGKKNGKHRAEGDNCPDADYAFGEMAYFLETKFTLTEGKY